MGVSRVVLVSAILDSSVQSPYQQTGYDAVFLTTMANCHGRSMNIWRDEAWSLPTLNLVDVLANSCSTCQPRNVSTRIFVRGRR